MYSHERAGIKEGNAIQEHNDANDSSRDEHPCVPAQPQVV